MHAPHEPHPPVDWRDQITDLDGVNAAWRARREGGESSYDPELGLITDTDTASGNCPLCWPAYGQLRIAADGRVRTCGMHDELEVAAALLGDEANRVALADGITFARQVEIEREVNARVRQVQNSNPLTAAEAGRSNAADEANPHAIPTQVTYGEVQHLVEGDHAKQAAQAQRSKTARERAEERRRAKAAEVLANLKDRR